MLLQQTAITNVKMSHELLEEYNQAMVMNAFLEKYFAYGIMTSKWPSAFKQVCIDGNLLAEITVYGEAAVQVSPMFPLHLYISFLPDK